MCDDAVTIAIDPIRARFKKGDILVHIVAGLPTRPSRWGTMLCGALFQWEPGTERRADKTNDAATCIMCIGHAVP